MGPGRRLGGALAAYGGEVDARKLMRYEKSSR